MSKPQQDLNAQVAKLKTLAKNKPTSANQEMAEEAQNMHQGLNAFINKAMEEAADYDMMKADEVSQICKFQRLTSC